MLGGGGGGKAGIDEPSEERECHDQAEEDDHEAHVRTQRADQIDEAEYAHGQLPEPERGREDGRLQAFSRLGRIRRVGGIGSEGRRERCAKRQPASSSSSARRPAKCQLRTQGLPERGEGSENDKGEAVSASAGV